MGVVVKAEPSCGRRIGGALMLVMCTVRERKIQEEEAAARGIEAGEEEEEEARDLITLGKELHSLCHMACSLVSSVEYRSNRALP